MTLPPAPERAQTTGPSRRQVLATTGVVAAAAAVTAACGSSAGGGGATGGGAPSAAGTTVAIADVPVGGGTILQDAQVVVTQPEAGTFKAFTAVCTHEGCLVAQVAQGAISCPCHGAQFSVSDGSVLGGPAPAPLAAVPFSVSGDTITLT
jgi:Rieske Fe-S protein